MVVQVKMIRPPYQGFVVVLSDNAFLPVWLVVFQNLCWLSVFLCYACLSCCADSKTQGVNFHKREFVLAV